MRIYLLRHGDASSDPNLDDGERPLTNLGVHQAATVGKYLHSMNINFDAVISSPLLRARQTTSIVQANNDTQKPITSDLLLNGINHQKLFDYLNTFNVSSILLVGHIPHLEKTISLIVNGIDDNNIELKKCSLAVIEVQKPIRLASGQLEQLIHIESIAGSIKS